jgi:hypothetical protein
MADKPHGVDTFCKATEGQRCIKTIRSTSRRVRRRGQNDPSPCPPKAAGKGA